MNIRDTVNLLPLDRFVYWIKERHQIYCKRQANKSKPWTDDEVLQNNFFTNPYREHDKVTKWFRRNIRGVYPYQKSSKVIFATICFRWFNWPPTGRILLQNNLLLKWNCEKAVKLLKEQDRVFTGAFNISNSGSTKPKVNRVCEDYITPVWEDRQRLIAYLREATTLEEAHKRIKLYPGLGGSGFMAYEVVCDLRYTSILNRATDKMTWSNPGPGAKRGLNRLLDRNLKSPISKDEWIAESNRLLRTVNRRILPQLPRFEAREIEHSLCEYDKYERVLFNQGQSKRKYNGT
jgi:hypothetical protein